MTESCLGVVRTLRSALLAGLKACGTSTYVIAIAASRLAACRQDMQDQPKYPPLRESSFFNDSRSARPLVAGTVARGHLRTDPVFETGRNGAVDADVFPLTVDAQLL